VIDTEQPSFERDIRPLFREMDRDAMDGAFDLWDQENASANAQLILAAVASGEMPCDGPWPPERVVLLGRWVEAGTPS
jgi:hypothetical protein